MDYPCLLHPCICIVRIDIGQPDGIAPVCDIVNWVNRAILRSYCGMVILWIGLVLDGIAPVCDGDIVDRVNGADQPDNT